MPLPAIMNQLMQGKEVQGQTADAFRVYMKAMKQGDGIVTSGTKTLRSLGSALEELF